MFKTEASDLFMSLEMLEARTRELEEYRFVDMWPLTPFDAMPGDDGEDVVHIKVPETINGEQLELEDEFSGRDRYLWLRKVVTLPEPRAGYQVAGLFDFGKTGDGGNSGFEGLLYLDRKPYQGIDTNHPDVLFENLSGQQIEMSFLLWTGLEGGGPRTHFRHRVKQAHLGYLHEATDEFYYLSKAIYKTLALLPDAAPEKYDLSNALDVAYRMVNWDADKIHASIEEALPFLLNRLDAIERRETGYQIGAVGHTHIDVAWLWRLKHTREKAVRSFSTVLRLMEEFDEYVFLQSQPQLYKFIKKDAPELYEAIKTRITEGRWEADGGMWVEADCNISSGESLVRQFVHGIRFFKKEFGARCEFLWLPDVFGYSWALPQILKQCNIKTFMTTKISWNQYNSIPHDLFRWRGIDGSEMLTYFVNTPEVGRPMDSRFSTYNGMISPRSVLGSWAKFRDKSLSKETLIPYGYGDGGGGVNRNMLKMRRAMDRLPGLPRIKPTKAGDFFKRTHQSVQNAEQSGKYVHTWDGELYLEYHRGTYTSQANIKKYNRIIEFFAARCEWLSCINLLSEKVYPSDILSDAWECVLLNQFHDIIPGSSIREVNEDTEKAYAATLSTLTKLEKLILQDMTEENENKYTLWHMGSFDREDLVLIPERRNGQFRAENDAVLPAQKTKDGWLVRVAMSALSMQEITFEPCDIEVLTDTFIWDENLQILDTPHYEISFYETGGIKNIFDKAARREVLAENSVGNALEVYEDKPINFDNWDIDIFHLYKHEYFKLVEKPELIENGAERAVLRSHYQYNNSTLQQDTVVYKASRRIDFMTNVDWWEKHRLLKVAFPLNLRATKATYDIQYGHVERPTHFNTSWDVARFEVVGHKWGNLSESSYGVSLLNDCKYGYSAKDNILRLSLLKSGKNPDTEADMGKHSFTYALYPYTGSLAQGGTIEESVCLNMPVQAVQGRLKEKQTLFKFTSGSVVIDAVKKAEDEDCYVLRLHECRGDRTKVDIWSDYGIRAWAQCNLLEENLESPVQKNVISTEFSPFEIQTYKIWI